MLLTETAREKLSQLSGKPVFNRYGSREFGAIAHECSQGRMHIISDRVHLELLKDDLKTPCQPGEEGEIIITDLDRKSMPLIRYRIGDRGIISSESCSCGRGYPLLRSVTGRSLDIVKCRGGETITASFWTHLSREIPGIRRFRIIQESLDSIIMLIELEDGASEKTSAIAESSIQERLDGKIKIHVVISDNFPTTTSGKMKFIESKLDNE